MDRPSRFFLLPASFPSWSIFGCASANPRGVARIGTAEEALLSVDPVTSAGGDVVTYGDIWLSLGVGVTLLTYVLLNEGRDFWRRRNGKP
jgi:hypothetical protein